LKRRLALLPKNSRKRPPLERELNLKILQQQSLCRGDRDRYIDFRNHLGRMHAARRDRRVQVDGRTSDLSRRMEAGAVEMLSRPLQRAGEGVMTWAQAFHDVGMLFGFGFLFIGGLWVLTSALSKY
jgi:hypothetical protein